jgi:hypothetical protein
MGLTWNILRSAPWAWAAAFQRGCILRVNGKGFQKGKGFQGREALALARACKGKGFQKLLSVVS